MFRCGSVWLSPIIIYSEIKSLRPCLSVVTSPHLVVAKCGHESSIWWWPSVVTSPHLVVA